MTGDDFTAIETRLELRLPADYRDVLDVRAVELRQVEWLEDRDGPLFLSADGVLRTNEREEPSDSGTSDAFPRWAETFWMIGTNGGGDFYCLRRDGRPGVWLIGSDCGSKPQRIASTFAEYVERLLENWSDELARRAEAERRQAIRSAETEAQLAAIERDDAAPRAGDWVTENRAHLVVRMLDELWAKPSPRKMRLYGLACCGMIPGLTEEPLLGEAIEAAKAMTRGEAGPEAVAVMRDALLGYIASLRSKYRNPEYRDHYWRAKSVFNLFQSDEDYLNDAPRYAGEQAELAKVYDAVGYVLYEAPYGTDVEAHLLREVLGNPFHPVVFDAVWRTQEVVELARTMFDEESFDRMSELADALEAAGCDDDRVLTHCRLECEHVRGCWVIDDLLELDSRAEDESFAWDYTIEHPTIDEAILKDRLREFGAGPDDEGVIHTAAAIGFADWLETNGDPDWSAYIRLRCRLDEEVPGDEYPDLLEDWIEVGERMPILRERFEGFYHRGYQFAEAAWWNRHFAADPWIRGLPTVVQAVPPGEGPRPIQLVTMQWEAAVRTTPIRGIDLESEYADKFGTFLDSPAARHLRWLGIENHPDEGREGPLVALLRSPSAVSIEWLDMSTEGRLSEAEVEALAEADLPKLRYFRMPGLQGVGEPLDHLMQTSWFRQLERLDLDLWWNEHPTVLRSLTEMPRLHTLSLFRPHAEQVEALVEASEFPALRRLEIDGGYNDPPLAPFSRLRAPLLELALNDCEASAADLATLFSGPLCSQLRILHLAGPRLDEDGFEIVGEGRFAEQLRVLRLHCGDRDLNGRMKSLAKTPLARGAFPSLTTLELRNPYKKKVKGDTAKLFRGMKTPNLRRLYLDECRFDEESAKILGKDETFSNLRRVVIRASPGLPREVAWELGDSPNLKNARVDVDSV